MPFFFQFLPELHPALNQLGGEIWQGEWRISTRTFDVQEVTLKVNQYPSSPLEPDSLLSSCPILAEVPVKRHQGCLLSSSVDSPLALRLNQEKSELSLTLNPPVDGRWLATTPLSFTIESDSPEELLNVYPSFEFLGLQGELGEVDLEVEMDEETSEVISAAWHLNYEYDALETQRILTLDLEWLTPHESPLNLFISWEPF